VCPIVPSRVEPPLAGALSVILPTPEQTLLLRACLCSGDASRQAWRQWLERAGDPKEALAARDLGSRRLLPLLFDAARRNGLAADKALMTHLKTANFRDELRSKAYRAVCSEAIGVLGAAGVRPVVLRGAALAETVYPEPVLRHCHDLDLWVTEHELPRAGDALAASGYACAQQSGTAARSLVLRHRSGVDVQLHTALFRLGYYEPPLDEMRERGRPCEVAGTPAWELSPADALLHVCGHAAESGSRENLCWAADAWFLITRSADLDWGLVADCALRGRLALPVSLMLGYLAGELGAPVPPAVLERLNVAAAQADGMAREAALLGAHRGTRGTLWNLVRAARGWREKAFVLRWALFPSPGYVRSVHGVRGFRAMAGWYAGRLGRGLRGCLSRRGGTRGNGRRRQPPQ
jgi:hypothetical protein